MHYKICDRILFEQALLTSIDKSSKWNHLQLHRQTPRRNLKATAGCVALPPCCKDAPAIGYFKSETLSSCSGSNVICKVEPRKVSQPKEIIKNHIGEVGWVDEQEFVPNQAQEHQDKASNLVSFEYLKPPQQQQHKKWKRHYLITFFACSCH